MDISPQSHANEDMPVPTPPPQPHFTPQAPAAPSNTGFGFSFGTGSFQPVSKQAAARQSPRNKKPAARHADLPKSRFMPPNASDTNSSSGTAFGPSAQAQPSSAGTGGIPGLSGAAGLAAQPSSAGTGGIPGLSGRAGFDAQPSANPTMPNGLANHQASQPAHPSLFASNARGSGAGFAFSVPGRPMDSRIPDACAMGFMGINLDSIPTQPASAQATAAPITTAGVHPAAAGSSAGHAQAAQQQQPSASFPSQHGAFSAFTFRRGKDASSIENQAAAPSMPPAHDSLFGNSRPTAAADDGVPTAPPSPFSFTMGAQTAPKQQFGHPIFGTEHLATNLHDKLVLEAELAAAAAASATGVESCPTVPDTAQAPFAAQQPMQAEVSSSAGGGDGGGGGGGASSADYASQANGPASTGTEAAQPQAQPLTTGGVSSAAPTTADPFPFVFGGSKPAAPAHQSPASSSAPGSQTQGFRCSSGAAASASQAPQSASTQQAPAQPPPIKSFIFGATASSVAAVQPGPGASHAGQAQPAPSQVSCQVWQPNRSAQHERSFSRHRACSCPGSTGTIHRYAFHACLLAVFPMFAFGHAS